MSAYNTDSERSHRCCHLLNNFGSCWICHISWWAGRCSQIAPSLGGSGPSANTWCIGPICVLLSVSETTFSCACVLIPFSPLFFFVLCVIVFFCLLSICNSYKYYIYMFGRPALMEYTTVLLFYCFFIVVNKISIHPSKFSRFSTVHSCDRRCSCDCCWRFVTCIHKWVAYKPLQAECNHRRKDKDGPENLTHDQW